MSCHVVLQEAVEALARAGLRNPVKVAVAVTATQSAAAAANGDGSSKSSKKRKQPDAVEQQTHSGSAAAAGDQKTPTSLKLEYVITHVEQKLPQLVSTSSCCSACTLQNPF